MASCINMAKLIMRHVLPFAAVWLLRDVSMHLQQHVQLAQQPSVELL